MKKIFKSLIASVASILAISSVCVSSAFADCTDSSWSSSHEYWRRKDNSTSVYVYNEGRYSTVVSVYGENTNNGRLYGNVSSMSNPIYSTHNTTYLTVLSGQRASIRQYINELGYSYAHLCVGNVSGNSTSGKWSPDSSRNYDLIN